MRLCRSMKCMFVLLVFLLWVMKGVSVLKVSGGRCWGCC